MMQQKARHNDTGRNKPLEFCNRDQCGLVCCLGQSQPGNPLGHGCHGESMLFPSCGWYQNHQNPVEAEAVPEATLN